jgi:hypothetical protein
MLNTVVNLWNLFRQHIKKYNVNIISFILV